MLQIHEKIKQARLSAGLTEDDLAKKIGIGRTTYSYWEKKTPNPDKIIKVAKALGLADDYFFINGDENKGINTDIKKDTLDKDVLRMVAQSNLNQSEANRNQSIANRKLAESISTLTHQFTVGGSSEIREEMADWFEKMFQIIRKLSAGQSVDEDLGTFWTSGKLKSDSSLNSNQDA